MALQIAPTPVLSGKDSELFNKSLKKGLKKKLTKKRSGRNAEPREISIEKSNLFSLIDTG